MDGDGGRIRYALVGAGSDRVERWLANFDGNQSLLVGSVDTRTRRPDLPRRSFGWASGCNSHWVVDIPV